MVTRNYGLPYMGSKSRIAQWVLDILPPAHTLVDIFFGGGAITHCAMEAGKYDKYICNDIRQTPQFFIDCMCGKLRNETRWVDRETFHATKQSDLYAAVCYSFGNNCRTYFCNTPLEPYKKAMHYAIIYDEWELLKALCMPAARMCYAALAGLKNTHDRRRAMKTCIMHRLPKEEFIIMPGGNQCQNLERLERCQNLERLERNSITPLNVDYRDVSIPAGAVVYCDPPYKDTAEDYGGFDTNTFLNWCVDVAKTNPVYISEYELKDNRFVCVAEKDRFCSAASKKNCTRTERIYTVKD